MNRLLFLVFAAALVAACSQDTLTDKEYYEKAYKYYNSGEIRASVIELKNALRKNPRNTDARILLGRIYADMADGVSAEKELRRAIEYGLQSDDVSLLLAKSLIQQGKFDEALVIIKSISTSGMENPEKLALQIEIYIAKREDEAAESAYKKLSSQKKSTPTTYIALGKYEIKNKQFDKAEQSINKALKIDSNSSEALLLLGVVAELQGKIKEAQDAYLKIINIEPKRGITPRLYQARIALANTYLHDKNFDLVNEQAMALYALNNKHVIPNYLLAVYAYHKKNYEKALEYLQVAHISDENHAPTLLLLGAVNYATGNYNQAESLLNQFVNRFPDNIVATRLLGASYLKLGDPSKAMSILKNSLENNPDDARLLSLVGEIAAQQGNIKEAEVYIRKSMTASGDITKGHMQLATTYLSSGDFDAAINELKELERVSGVDEYSRVRALVFAYLKKNQTDDALSEARQYATRFPSEARAFNLLAAVYMSIRDIDTAKKHFNNALRIDSKDKIAMLSLARLALVQKDGAQARSWLQKIINLDKTNVAAIMLMARIEEQENKKEAMVEWLEKARSVNESIVPPRLVLANYYFREKEYAKVHTYIDEILKVQNENQLALGLLIDTYWQENKKAKALSTAELLVSKAPNLPETHNKLGRVYAGLNEIDKARESFKRALTLQPRFTPASIALAKIEVNAGNQIKALDIAKKLQKMQPNSPAGLVLQGDIHMEMKNYSKAFQSYKAAFKLGQNSTIINKQAVALYHAGEKWPVIQSLFNSWLDKHPADDVVLLRLATIAQSRGEINASIFAYRKILEHRPDNAVVLNDLAWILYESEKNKEAITLAQRAHELQPHLAAVQDTYGWILVQEGDVRKGLRLLKGAHEAIPGNPDIAYHYAYALNKAGNQGEAKALLSNILKDKKKFSSRQAAEKLLKEL